MIVGLPSLSVALHAPTTQESELITYDARSRLQSMLVQKDIVGHSRYRSAGRGGVLMIKRPAVAVVRRRNVWSWWWGVVTLSTWWTPTTRRGIHVYVKARCSGEWIRKMNLYHWLNQQVRHQWNAASKWNGILRPQVFVIIALLLKQKLEKEETKRRKNGDQEQVVLRTDLSSRITDGSKFSHLQPFIDCKIKLKNFGQKQTTSILLLFLFHNKQITGKNYSVGW